MALDSYDTFEAVKSRLDEIVDAVGNAELPLDDALALYEEAVGLGLRASDLLEENIEAQRAEDEAAAEGDGAQPVADAAAAVVAEASAPARDEAAPQADEPHSA